MGLVQTFLLLGCEISHSTAFHHFCTASLWLNYCFLPSKTDFVLLPSNPYKVDLKATGGQVRFYSRSSKGGGCGVVSGLLRLAARGSPGSACLRTPAKICNSKPFPAAWPLFITLILLFPLVLCIFSCEFNVS